MAEIDTAQSWVLCHDCDAPVEWRDSHEACDGTRNIEGEELAVIVYVCTACMDRRMEV